VKSRFTPVVNGTSISTASDTTNTVNSSMNSSASLPNGIVANGDLTNHDNTVTTRATSISVNALNGSLVNRNEYSQQHSLKSKILSSIKKTRHVLKLSKSSRQTFKPCI